MTAKKEHAASFLTRGLYKQAVFSLSFWHLEVGMNEMYQYMVVCASMF
jgi:hypothetical protein